jgi:hypothetical protein
MGVAQYRQVPALPDQLRRDLPTVEDLAQEFPAMSALKLRFEIERALRDFTAVHGVVSERPMSIRIVLEGLKQHGVARRVPTDS